MEYSIEQKRIEYFDLMKGICIVLVVVCHCYEELGLSVENKHLWSMLEHLRMPLYFFLSGMFFKEYSCFVDFVIRKTNKLIIPFLFFTILTVIPKLLTGEVECNLIPIKKHFTWMIKYGGYLWFLRTLFLANILYYVVHKFIIKHNIYVSACVIIVLTIFGWLINSFIPIDGDFRETYTYLTSIITAFLVLPFFFVASNIRTYLPKMNNIKVMPILFVFLCSLLLCFLTSNGGVYLKNAKIENGFIEFYLAAFSAIIAVWCICFMIKRMYYFTYVGRYSIIVYLTHIPIIHFIVFKGWILSLSYLILVVLAIMPVMIWFFKKFFPAFVAQRDIFVYEKGKVKVDWNVFTLKNR